MLTSGNRQQSPSSSSTRRGKDLSDWDWLSIRTYGSAEVGIFIMCHPRTVSFCGAMFWGRGKKKTAISNWLNCQMLAAGVMESALVYKISCGLLETNTATTKPRIPCITEVLFILSFLPSVCLNRKIAMRIKMLPAHVGLIYSLISACILPPAPTTYAECI